MVRLIASVMALATLAQVAVSVPLPAHEAPANNYGGSYGGSGSYGSGGQYGGGYSPPEKAHVTTIIREKMPSKPTAMPVYGSGGGGNAGYDGCVQKCLAQYGTPPTLTQPPPAAPPAATTAPPAAAAPPPAAPPAAGGQKTVIVAPALGVLRYVPAFMNATVGETIKFVWGAPANHTVSKGSALDLCNRTSDNFFASGIQQAPFEFSVTINDTNPLFLYCAVGRHCASGMFGIVNPTASFGGDQSIGVQMASMAAANPNIQAAMTATNLLTKGTSAESWGQSALTDQIPEANRKALMENVLFTRAFYASNPGAMEALENGQGTFDMASMKIPTDIQTLLTATSGSPNGAGGLPVSGVPSNTAVVVPASTSAASAEASIVPGNSGASTGPTSSASALRSSSVLVAIVAVFATFMAL